MNVAGVVDLSWIKMIIVSAVWSPLTTGISYLTLIFEPVSL